MDTQQTVKGADLQRLEDLMAEIQKDPSREIFGKTVTMLDKIQAWSKKDLVARFYAVQFDQLQIGSPFADKANMKMVEMIEWVMKIRMYMMMKATYGIDQAALKTEFSAVTGDPEYFESDGLPRVKYGLSLSAEDKAEKEPKYISEKNATAMIKKVEEHYFTKLKGLRAYVSFLPTAPEAIATLISRFNWTRGFSRFNLLLLAGAVFCLFRFYRPAAEQQAEDAAEAKATTLIHKYNDSLAAINKRWSEKFTSVNDRLTTLDSAFKAEVAKRTPKKPPAKKKKRR